MRIRLTVFLVISFLINSAQTGRIIGVVFDEDKVSVPFTTLHIEEINMFISSICNVVKGTETLSSSKTTPIILPVCALLIRKDITKNTVSLILIR